MDIRHIGYASPATYRTAALSRQQLVNRDQINVEKASGEEPLSSYPYDEGIYDMAGRTGSTTSGFRTAPPNGYEQYMPTRPGFSSNNLALAVTDPRAEPFSAGLTKTQVAEAARKAIDARYAQMNESGTPYSGTSNEGIDNNSAFGDLDRRALNAIYTDRTGLFSKDEKALAQSLMSQQLKLAMGLYTGPSRLESTFPHSGNTTEETMRRNKAGALWLDKVSLDEKMTSPMWYQDRANTQRLNEWAAKQLNQKPDSLNSGFSLVDALLKTSQEQKERNPELMGYKGYAEIVRLFEKTADQYEAPPVSLYL